MKKAPHPKTIPIQVITTRSEPVFRVGEGQPIAQEAGKIYSRAVAGLFTRLRWVMVWVTQLVFYGVPWLQWNDRQAVLFDLTEGRFFVFGLVLHPQDLFYLAVLLVVAALTLFFFTAVAGRLWCGYACPQTVYTEIFLWIERITEGDRLTRMRLDKGPWGLHKITRKGAKQAMWIVLSLFTGFTFVGYFTPIQHLARELLGLSLSPWEWFWVLFYGFATYGNAGYLREQICKQMCPYARIQSALTDMDSMVIAYDAARGETRGSRARTADARSMDLGDCIDCTLCVQVCPTGIDIRNGLQNECIACAACIDVCDEVMQKMNYPKGLIRYSSGKGMTDQLTATQMLHRVWRPRVWVYGFLLMVALSVFVGGLATRKGFEVDVIKDRGTMARETANGSIENVYRLQVMNTTEAPQTYRASVHGLTGLTLATPPELTVASAGIGSMNVRLTLPVEVVQAHRGKTSPIRFRVEVQGEGEVVSVEEKSTFVVPR